MKKTILTLLAFITLLTSVAAIPANAAIADPGETVMPLWDNTLALNISIIFQDNGYGYAEGTIVGYTGVTQIVVDVTVYQQTGTNWSYVTDNQTTINGRGGAFSCPFPTVSGAYYKAEYTITVTKNGVNEVIEKEKYAICE